MSSGVFLASREGATQGKMTGMPALEIPVGPKSSWLLAGRASETKGLRPSWTRAAFIVREEVVQQLKAVANWERKEWGSSRRRLGPP